MHFWLNSDVKIRILSIMVFIPLLFFSDHSKATEEQVASTKILILGDSLSAAYGLTQEQGWVSLLQNAWQDQSIKVVNAAISGETTDGGLARLPRLLEQHSPDFILIELGGNDGLQGHPVNKIKDNLGQMIAKAQQQNVTVLLQQMQIPTNYGRRYNDMFIGIYAELSEQYGVELIPFFMQDIALDKSLMQKDGIHPNLEAQPIIAKFMQQKLTPFLVE